MDEDRKKTENLSDKETSSVENLPKVEDTEFVTEPIFNKVNPHNETKVKMETDPQKNMNHLRNKQLY